MLLTISAMMYFSMGMNTVENYNYGTLKVIGVIFIGSFSLMTPFLFYSMFGKVWMNGITSLEKERLKMEEEMDKYIKSRIKVNKWLDSQINDFNNKNK